MNPMRAGAIWPSFIFAKNTMPYMRNFKEVDRMAMIGIICIIIGVMCIIKDRDNPK